MQDIALINFRQHLCTTYANREPQEPPNPSVSLENYKNITADVVVYQ